MQFAAFYIPKGHLLACKRWSFAKRKAVFCQDVDNQLFTCGRLFVVKLLPTTVMNILRIMRYGRPAACSSVVMRKLIKVKRFYSKKVYTQNNYVSLQLDKFRSGNRGQALFPLVCFIRIYD